ncbi:MAG: dihydrofolate reductase [Hydrocarboniphaga sp.]|uniref:dihydrofolate reductase n=1 Tax=Hydrocarboniphaga sp. TaxID=2033016 RepID=UPI002630B381|nr:dihydrofolate reductase [Hydrocarboniphaga sp.]MDB5968166.1 dihydrofolate reductase [Hydrocarboniphaga sp.]
MIHLSLVVAASENGVIGREGGLPWKLPADLQHFKRLTLGKTILMGRKTWQSLGRPLPQRDNWVISRDPLLDVPGARVFQSLDHACTAAEREKIAELMVIGGAQIYAQALPLADTLYLTRVHAQIDGDTRFPDYDAGQFIQTQREDHAADERHLHAYSFITLRRQNSH